MFDNYALTMVSKNEKTGAIPVSSSNSGTCPPSCALKGVCYAGDHHTGIHWRAIDRGDRGADWPQFIREVATIRPGRLWRYGVAGDLPGADDKINGPRVRELVTASRGRRGFAFSHYPITGKHGAYNRRQLAAANRAGFTINHSANTIAAAVQAVRRYAIPTVAVAPVGYFEAAGKNSVTLDGVVVTRCPAEHSQVQCIDCGICAKPGRGCVIAFEAHGKNQKQVDLIARS